MTSGNKQRTRRSWHRVSIGLDRGNNSRAVRIRNLVRWFYTGGTTGYQIVIESATVLDANGNVAYAIAMTRVMGGYVDRVRVQGRGEGEPHLTLFHHVRHRVPAACVVALSVLLPCRAMNGFAAKASSLCFDYQVLRKAYRFRGPCRLPARSPCVL